MIQIKKLDTGFFRVYVDDVESQYTIQLASAYGCGSGKVFYDVFKNTERINHPMIKLSLHKAKQKAIAEILKKGA